MSLIRAVAMACQGNARKGFIRNMSNHCVSFLPRNDKLLVTFDHMGSVHSEPPRLPWGHNLAEAMGWSHLGNMTKRNDWFRDAEMYRIYRKLRDQGFFKGFDEVVFYGASMGGFAAASFSVVSPGARVVAMSPQSTLRRDLVPWERRYLQGRRMGDWDGKWSDAARAVQGAREVKLFYDPYFQPDADHAARFDTGNITRYRAPFLGHKLPRQLQDMGVLTTVASRAIKGGLNHEMWARMLAKRKDSPAYYEALAERAEKAGHVARARVILQAGQGRAPHKRLAKALDRVAEAEAEAEAAAASGSFAQ